MHQPNTPKMERPRPTGIERATTTAMPPEGGLSFERGGMVSGSVTPDHLHRLRAGSPGRRSSIVMHAAKS